MTKPANRIKMTNVAKGIAINRKVGVHCHKVRIVRDRWSTSPI